jgi:ribose transport system substrate-binding protein
LQAIVDGHCYGTIVQDPYQYGYESVRILAGLARGDRSVLPDQGFIHIPAREIKRENVESFWAELKRMTAQPAVVTASTSQDRPVIRVSDAPVKLAFVTNNASDFWKIAEAGVRKAELEFGVECEVQLPASGTADDQQRIIEALIARGIAGMAVSPNDAENQVDIINRAAAAMPVICHDSDAPKSNRLAYVGTRNYRAGREAGKQIKAVLPRGGKIMMFVGRLDAQNASERAQGVRDELQGSNVEIIDTRVDLTDRARAKQNVEDTLTSHPDVGCLVGLWSYNGPAILEAVTDVGLAGKKGIVCFDEEARTLQGVADGHIHATIVQQPFEFGYQSVRILAALARGQDPGIPSDGIIEVPVRVIHKGNVQAFRKEVAQLMQHAK